MSSKAKIAWFSPLACPAAGNSNSSSAYVTNQLVPLLKESFDIDLYHMGIGDFLGCPTLCHQRSLANHRHEPYDLLFFQIEDHLDCDFILNYLDATPKVILIHDINFKPNRTGPTLNQINNSLALLFSSERNISEYIRLCSEPAGQMNDPSDAFLLPYPVQMLEPSDTHLNENFIISYCGKPTSEFRAHKLLQAIKVLKFPTQLNWLIEESEQAEATKLLLEFSIDNAKLILNRSPQTWSQLVPNSNVAIHTLFSTYGDPGPYLPISMASGCPTVVTNFSTGEYLPDSIVFKVDPGVVETPNLCLVLSEIHSSQSNGSLLSFRENSLKYVKEVHNNKAVAYELELIFKRCLKQKDTIQSASRSIQ